MTQYHIRGTNQLSGTIKVSGAKNAALKLMCASLLTDKEVILENVPSIEDVSIMAEVLRSLGAEVEIKGEKVLIKADNLNNCNAPYDLVNKMRASILVMGPLLAKLGRTKVAMPGGCKIGLRKIDFHIKGLEALGAEISLEHGYIDAKANKLEGCEIGFDFPSVGATENILMAAVLAQGKTIIKNAAKEPELVDLINFLNFLGAKIEGAGSDCLIIEGVKSLNGGTYRVIADRIEAGTFLVAGAVCAKELKITDFNPEHLLIVLEKLHEAGAKIEKETNGVIISKADSIRPLNIATLPYPGLPTDLQGLFMALLSKADGRSIVTENVFEDRFFLADKLRKLGAKIEIQGHRALIEGVDRLVGCEVEATDLRAGAALVIAGLMADGLTIVKDIYHIDRGYEGFDDKLVSVGAQIERKNENQVLEINQNLKTNV